MEVLFSAHFQICDDTSADPQLRAEFAGGDVVLDAEGGNLSVNSMHIAVREWLTIQDFGLANKILLPSCSLQGCRAGQCNVDMYEIG